jgi:hypothetical protein
MLVRRRLSILERPISSASKAGRTWYGYSAYNPQTIVKLFDIFRVVYNYCPIGKSKVTPAVRLGLAKGPVTLEDIIYFTQDSGFPKLNRAKPGAAKPKSKPTAASARPEESRPWIF